MAIKPILCIPDNQLRLISTPVAAITDDIRRLMDDMITTMHDAVGIGLAAIQIGVPKRVIVLGAGKASRAGRPIVMANPEIIWAAEEKAFSQEGCLSIPDYYEDVERPVSVRARYLDRHGETQELEAEGILATALQHEIDHLNGILFIDHISRLKRERVWKKFVKAARRSADMAEGAETPRMG